MIVIFYACPNTPLQIESEHSVTNRLHSDKNITSDNSTQRKL